MPTSQAQSTSRTAFVEAVLPIPLRRSFTYRIPAEMPGEIELGARVLVPFGKRELTGYVVGLHAQLPKEIEIDESKIRDVIRLLDAEPLITPEILKLTQWTADYYASFWGEMLKAALPAGINTERVRPKRRKSVRLTGKPSAEHPDLLNQQQRKILDLISNNQGEMYFTDVLEQAETSASPVNTLVKRGFVEIFAGDEMRDPLAGAELPSMLDLTLTAEQQSALDEIAGALNDELKYKAFLLHGVTGSGKTEVYIRAMRRALDLGLSALMLVPEIALTPLFSRRLRAFFGPDVAILHSNLSAGERFDEWRRIRRGDARIAIGTRSAVFAPLENIGLIIVDEEHDPSYRQHESPFYNARDVAVMRANLAGAVAVLGSATPAMESFYNAQSGKYGYLRLPERIGGRGLATAELIDMREVFKLAGKDVPLSPELLRAIKDTFDLGEQTIILLNRRGFSQFVLCRTCGETLKCNNCDITLTFHRSSNKLICHYCNYREDTPHLCPHCDSEYLYFVGEGTENIADQLEKKFPDMRIARVDRDTMAHKGEMEDVLLKFAAGAIDLLVGTQMIAKGHDFPNVTLVGVISVDIGLGLPDLRSAERTFQLVTQVAGRAGRGERSGRVLVQTYYPEHYALRHAKQQDYMGFYAEEIKFRERLAYPPFVVLAAVLIKHRDLSYASKNANLLKRSLDHVNSSRSLRILGPAPASLSRLKNEYRLQLIIKSTSRKLLREILNIALAEAEERGCDMRTINVEIDPVSLM
jgi:primosomal protein N' (replication factor Y)